MDSIVKNSPDQKTPSPISEKAIQLLQECGNGAQTSFAILNEEHDLDGDQILKASTPFPRIALNGETCDVVTDSLLALGLVYGREKLKVWNAYIRSLRPARKFCARFEERYGRATCTEILQEQLGQTYDLADKAEALHYADSGGPQACAEVVVFVKDIASRSITMAGR